MRRMRCALVLIGVVASMVVPAEASALVLAPPGHAGANQYFETIPTSAGNAAPPGSVSGSGSSQALAGLGQGRSTDARLAQLGKDGRAAAALAASTAPSHVSAAAAANSLAGGSISSGVAHALTGSDTGGLGIAMPLLLGTVLVAALGVVGVAVVRVRTRPSPK
jgi:hypothetical protein